MVSEDRADGDFAMHTFAKKPNVRQPAASASSMFGRTQPGQNHEHLAPRADAPPRRTEVNTAASDAETTAPSLDWNFGRIPVHAPVPARLQAKLELGMPGDIHEQEADRVADQVMRMPEPKGRSNAPVDISGDATAPAPRVQTKSTHAGSNGGIVAPPLVHDVLCSPGQPLDAATRAFMEPRFGRDFSGVRVHIDSRAVEANRAVRAKAFTVGNHLAFGLGQYAPATQQGKSLIAHELMHTVQQSGSPILLQRAENDTVAGCAALTDSQSDVDAHVNASLTAARAAAGTPPAGARVARGVWNDLGADAQPGRTAIEVWASTLPPTKASLPAQSATKYAGVGYRLWSNPLFPILNPTMKINSVCVGSDKLGHFFQQGWTFRQTEAASGSAAAEEESERSEGGGFGLTTTGVFSNADQEANRQGSRFYNDLIAAPGTTFAIARYISSRWSEVDNPNFYETGVGHQVWANVLTGTWAGESWAGVPFLAESLSATLTATTSGTLTGTFTVGAGGAIGTISNGVIRYDTTTVRGKTILGRDTTQTPISSVHIDFNWVLGSESGKGFLDSGGERQLAGRWGRGASNTDRGAWQINRT
jgi:hypothetical protein